MVYLDWCYTQQYSQINHDAAMLKHPCPTRWRLQLHIAGKTSLS